MIFDQNHEQVSLFMVLFENEDNDPVLSTQWNFGSNGFFQSFFTRAHRKSHLLCPT